MQMSESCHTHEWVMSHTWMSQDSRINESRHTPHFLSPCARKLSGWVMPHTWMSHVMQKTESHHAHVWVMSRTWMSHVTCINESCTHLTSYLLALESSRGESCHTHEWVMSCKRLSHIMHMYELCHACKWVASHALWVTSHTSLLVSLPSKPLWMSHDTHMSESCHT